MGEILEKPIDGQIGISDDVTNNVDPTILREPEFQEDLITPSRTIIPYLSRSPLFVLVILIVGVFISELIAMYVVHLLQPLSLIQEAFIDALIMTLMVFPLAYLLTFRPLMNQIAHRRRAELELKKAAIDLEIRVEERTRALTIANKSLMKRQSEIEALLHGTRAVLEHREFNEIARIIFDACKDLVGASAGYVALVEGEDNKTLFLDFGGADHQVDRSLRMPVRELRNQAILHSKPFYINEFENSEWAQYLPEDHARLDNVLISPLKIDQEVVGLIGLANKSDGFTNSDSELAAAFGEMAALALLNCRVESDLRQAHSELERRVAERTIQLARANKLLRAEIDERRTIETQLEQNNRELIILNEASLALTQMLDLDVLISTLLEYMNKLVPSDSSHIVLIEDDQQLTLRATHGYYNNDLLDSPQGMVIDVQRFNFVQNLLASQRVILIPDTSQYEGWQNIIGDHHISNWLGVPLVAGRKVIGFYALEKEQPHYFTADHIRLAETLVGQAATNIQNAWLYEQVRAGRHRLQTLSHRLVEVQESERHYIAHELHDEAGQALASLMVNLDLLEKAAENPEAIRSEVAEMEKTLLNVQDNLHRLAMTLRPASLDHLGLVAAVRQHIEMVREKHSLDIQFEAVKINDHIPSNIQTGVYRVVQEALTNIIRHSRASKVDILVNQRGETLSTIIEDDGQGFDVEAALKKERLGLLGMRERAEMLGGTLLIESSIDGGTTIALEVPYVNQYSGGR